MIGLNKNNLTTILKILKEIIRDEPMSTKEIKDKELKYWVRLKGKIADKFNLYYIQNISNIVGSIDESSKFGSVY